MTTHSKPIRSVEEFIKRTSPIREKWFREYEDYNALLPWFRGQEDASWELVPKLYRGENPGDLEIESEIREEFCRRAPALSDYAKPSDNQDTNNWEWYFVMQHYGAPTRLIDWTESSLIALYFSVKENKGNCDAAVWLLNAWKLNEEVIKTYEVIPPADSGTQKEDRAKVNPWLPDRFKHKSKLPIQPVAVFPTHTMRRISAQRSCFTIHGSEHNGFRGKLKPIKLLIARDEIKQIRFCRHLF